MSCLASKCYSQVEGFPSLSYNKVQDADVACRSPRRLHRRCIALTIMCFVATRGCLFDAHIKSSYNDLPQATPTRCVNSMPALNPSIHKIAVVAA